MKIISYLQAGILVSATFMLLGFSKDTTNRTFLQTENLQLVKQQQNIALPVFSKAIPKQDVLQLSQKFDQIIINGEPLRNEFHVDTEQFMTIVSESEKDYANFVFIQDGHKFAFMLHLSDSQQNIEAGDKLYFFQENTQGIFLPVEEQNLNMYSVKRTEYNNGLGLAIAVATNTGSSNTQIVSHSRADILAFWQNHLSELPNEATKYLEFKMIQFTPVASSSFNDYYTEHQRRIAFVVRLDYGISVATNYYDFGFRIP